MKKGAFWGMVEFWSWITMFIILIVFLLLFKACSPPTLQQIQSATLTNLASRQEALLLMETPVEYRPQNTTLAYVIAAGANRNEFDEAQATILTILQRADRLRGSTDSQMQLNYAMRIQYADRTVNIGPGTTPSDLVLPLDTYKLPDRNGNPVTVEIGTAISLGGLP